MKYLPILLMSIFLFSCGGNKKSEKGSWTSDDMKKCIDKANKALAFDRSEIDMFEALNEDMDAVFECICEELEDRYKSWNVADLAAENDMSDQEGIIMMMGCFSENMQNLMRLGMEQQGEW